jgi:CheY-like chemotaxis protein
LKKILVIDDEPEIRNLVCDVLSSSYDVTEFDTADKIVKYCQQNTVDLIITDMFMPGITGLELINIIKNINDKIKLLAISGGARMKSCDILPAAKTKGADSSLAKPFTPHQLREKVEILLV